MTLIEWAEEKAEGELVVERGVVLKEQRYGPAARREVSAVYGEEEVGAVAAGQRVLEGHEVVGVEEGLRREMPVEDRLADHDAGQQELFAPLALQKGGAHARRGRTGAARRNARVAGVSP